MDAAWVAERNRASLESYLSAVHKLADYIAEKRAEGMDFSYKNDDALTIIIQDEISRTDPNRVDYRRLALACWGFLYIDLEGKIRPELESRFGEKFCCGLDSTEPFDPNFADTYLDKEFELSAGDYIITDPCYIEQPWDYDAIKAGAPEPTRFWEPAFKAAMPSIHMRDTLYGDWGCTVFDTADIEFEDMPREQKEACAVGRFCADAGEVCVVRYDEVASFNPGFVSKLEADIAEKGRLGCHYATIIRNFEGTGAFDVREEEYEYKGKTHKDYYVVVRLSGKDTATGKAVNYESCQTSL